jgi:hypothetical protein
MLSFYTSNTYRVSCNAVVTLLMRTDLSGINCSLRCRFGPRAKCTSAYDFIDLNFNLIVLIVIVAGMLH